MCQCTLCADRFLRGLHDSTTFEMYRRARSIGGSTRPPSRREAVPIEWWIESLRSSPDEQRERVEWEQLAVPELATPCGYFHLLAAASVSGWKGPTWSGGLGEYALRFLLDRPELFRAVYCQHSRREPDVWRAARSAIGLDLPQPESLKERVASDLGRLFGAFSGVAGEIEVTAHSIPGAVFVSARLDRGTANAEFCPAFADFVYYPVDGTLLLRSPWSAAQRTAELLDCLGGTVLNASLKDVQPGFELERLKEPFHPLPDSDLLSVRVRSLHLRYPGRKGRREVRLETRSSDHPGAIQELLRAHGGRTLDELSVCHAVLQVRLKLNGCEKTHLVRLWPDRCDAGQGPLRTRILSGLRRWGL